MATAAPVASSTNSGPQVDSTGAAFKFGGDPGASIPTTAPKAPTATPPATPQSNPTAVVGSGQAASYVQNTIQPALQSAQQNLTNQNAKVAALNTPQVDSAGNPFTFGGSTPPPTGSNPASGTPNNNQPTQTPENTPGTPEHTLLNTPEAGNQFIYDQQGNRTQVPVGQVPQGFSTTAPTPITANDAVTQSNGTTIKQMSDGSYASYNAARGYQGPATQQQFQDATTANTLANNIAQLANGSFPLTQSEQAQVTALQASFQALITQQQTANANFTGGTTVAMNLYGMGNSVTGLGEIKGSIDSGIAKIADLNGKMASAVSQMEDAFRTEDMNMMKSAYDVLNTAQKDRQAALDKVKADTDAAAKDMRDYNEKVTVDQQNEQHQQFQDAMASANLDEKQKTDAFSEYIQQADLTEKQKQDAVDNYYKGVTASHEAASLKIQQENADTNLAKLQQTGSADTNAVVGNLTTTPSGNKFVDGTGLTADQKSLAMQHGQVVLDGPKLQTMTSLTNIQQQFGALLASMQGAGVLNQNFQFTMQKTSWGSRGSINVGATDGFLHTHTAGDATPALKDFNTSIFGTDNGSSIKSGSILADLTKLPDTGTLVATIKQNALKDGDDAKTMQTKISAITNLLVTSENSLLSNGASAGQRVISYNGKNYSVDSSGNMTPQ